MQFAQAMSWSRQQNALPVAVLPGQSQANAACISRAERAVRLRADNNGYVTVRLPSGEQRLVLERCMATIGSLSNAQHKNQKLGRAGASRWLGRRPTVRGVAMNSVDHPHGGGRCALRAVERLLGLASPFLERCRLCRHCTAHVICQMPLKGSAMGSTRRHPIRSCCAEHVSGCSRPTVAKLR